jgi:hypothetical protein
MRKITALLCICLIQLTAVFAHVGSPDVLMQGNAGPYKLLVSIKPPDVIPGVAKVKVYLQGGDVSSIALRAVYFRSGDEGAPEADKMIAVDGQPGQYVGETWMMNGGSSSVQITVNGAQGKGEIIVPVVAMSTAKKDLPASTGYMLAGLGIFLFVLMLTIIGASVSDALTRGGEAVPARRKKIRVVGVAVAAILTSLIVYGGNSWWQSWAKNYTKFMFKPTEASSVVTNQAGMNELKFLLDTSNNAQRKTSYSYVMPDHGKMMHMFVMRLPAMDAFAHLHPIRVDSATYRTILPGLPKGRYLVFADIVYGSGYTETIKDTFEIAGNLTDSLKRLDADDAYAFAIPNDVVDNPQVLDAANTIVCGKPGTGLKLKDGSFMVWEGMTNEPFETDKVYSLKFTVLTPDKRPAVLDAYLGMGGHAAIIRNDGNVYMHLHPMGTLNMAAETNFVKRIAEPQGEYKYPDAKVFRDSIDKVMKHLSTLSDTARNSLLMKQMNMQETETTTLNGMNHSNTVEFPYSFPSPGQYRIWVQVKRNGQVLTGAFDKIVK